MTLSITKATKTDVPTVVEILNEANEYKIRQSDNAWGSEPFTEDEIKHEMTKGDYFLVSKDGEALGTFELFWEDKRIWDGRPDDTCYLHRLAVRNNAHGQGIGAEMVDLACLEVSKVGRKYLRLDCDGRNTKLCAYYKTLGFTKVGSKQVDSGAKTYNAALFEKQC